jgi:2-keto-4-pentenoate hydratase
MDERRTAALIWHRWSAGEKLQSLPEDLRPTTREDGYRAQACLPAVAGRQVAGWKNAATSSAGQKHIGVGGPLAGRILSGQIQACDASVSLRGNGMRVVEPEFAFRMARDLAPRLEPYTANDVIAAAETLHLALELPDSRFAQFATAGEAQLLADNACAHLFVIGGATEAAWRDIDLAAHGVLATVVHRDGRTWSRRGSGSAVLGDPRLALAWLANELSSLGVTLEAGQIVSTGTCMPPLEVVPGDRVDADFGALGRIGVTVLE